MVDEAVTVNRPSQSDTMKYMLLIYGTESQWTEQERQPNQQQQSHHSTAPVRIEQTAEGDDHTAHQQGEKAAN